MLLLLLLLLLLLAVATRVDLSTDWQWIDRRPAPSLLRGRRVGRPMH